MGALTSAVSGMEAASLRLDVAANNIANSSTPGFQPSEVALAATAGGGVSARVVPGQAPPTIAGLPANEQPSGTDLIQEMATVLEAPLGYAANARVVRAQDEATATLLDTFA